MNEILWCIVATHELRHSRWDRFLCFQNGESVSKGIQAYRKASDKSAEKKRDGAIRDFGLNLAKGLSKSLCASSSVPVDIAEALDGRGARRRTRRQVRAVAKLNRRIFRLR